MSKCAESMLVFGIVWLWDDYDGGPMWPSVAVEALGTAYQEAQDHAFDLHQESVLEVALGLPVPDPDDHDWHPRAERLRAAQIAAWGVELVISEYYDSNRCQGCFVAHARGEAINVKGGTPADASSLLEKGGRPEVVAALRKLAALLPGASEPGWYVGNIW